ncbi:MAG: hypothetical protein IT580_13525, partial [Verrucomicrobiales bacterium]|nr:hypothetical protein [Verrucomicrobiales bacterium]
MHLLLLGTVLASVAVGGPRWEVVHLGDTGEGSLRNAIELANAAGTGEIGFAGLDGVIQVGSPLPTLAANVRLVGPTNRSITLSGAGQHALLSVASGVTVEISRLTFTLARASQPRHGSALSNAGSLRLLHCRFEGNTNELGWGGAIYSEGDLLIQDSVFQNNAALGTPGTPGRTPNVPHRSFGGGAGAGGSGMGGAVYQARGTLDLLRCEFLNNTARGGSGIVPPSPPLMIEMEGGLGGKAYGGALFCFDGTTRIVGCRFT